MIIFIDVKKDRTEFHSIDGSVIVAPAITDHDSFKLFLADQSSQAAIHDLYPNFFIDAGYMTQEVIELVEMCGIPNVYAVKLMEDDLRIIATSGKQQRAVGGLTDSNTLTMRLIQHSIKLHETKAERDIKQGQDKPTPQLTHQETTDRINALATALEKIGNAQSVRSAQSVKVKSSVSSNLKVLKEHIVFELAQLVISSVKAAPQPPEEEDSKLSIPNHVEPDSPWPRR